MSSKKRRRAPAESPPLSDDLESLSALYASTLLVASFLAPKGAACTYSVLRSAVAAQGATLSLDDLRRMVGLDNSIGLRPHAAGGRVEPELVLRDARRLSAAGVKSRLRHFRSLLAALPAQAGGGAATISLAPLPAGCAVDVSGEPAPQGGGSDAAAASHGGFHGGFVPSAEAREAASPRRSSKHSEPRLLTGLPSPPPKPLRRGTGSIGEGWAEGRPRAEGREQGREQELPEQELPAEGPAAAAAAAATAAAEEEEPLAGRDEAARPARRSRADAFLAQLQAPPLRPRPAVHGTGGQPRGRAA